MKVLIVTYGTSMSPATRYRVEQYLPYLSREGISYACLSILSSRLTLFLIRTRSTGGLPRGLWILCEQLVGFFRVCIRVPWYDVIFFQRVVFPFGLEKIIKVLNRKIIYDLDDAIHLPVEHKEGILGRFKRMIKGGQVQGALSVSNHCICENMYIKAYVERYCPKVTIITGPIDSVRNSPVKKQGAQATRGILTIGWVGSPATSPYLDIIRKPIKEIAKRFNVRIKLVGVKDYTIDGVSVVSKDWSYDTEVDDIQTFDIGVCPMFDNEWTRGKVSVKILQYMANGVPTVVSYTPTNEETVRDGIDGFLARDEGEWVEILLRLAADPGLRRTIGLRGRKTVEERYSLDASAPVLLKIIRDTVSM